MAKRKNTDKDVKNLFVTLLILLFITIWAMINYTDEKFKNAGIIYTAMGALVFMGYKYRKEIFG